MVRLKFEQNRRDMERQAEWEHEMELERDMGRVATAALELQLCYSSRAEHPPRYEPTSTSAYSDRRCP